MDDPDFTADHLEQLRRVDDGRELARTQALGTSWRTRPIPLIDIVGWGLVRWDAGAGVRPCRTVKEYAPLVRIRAPQHRVTHAGHIVLEQAKSLDGTVAPPELCHPAADKKGSLTE